MPPPSFLTPKAEKLLPKIEKAGVKAALKAGHVLNRAELLNVRVQLLPTLFRWTLAGGSAAAAYGSYQAFAVDHAPAGWGLAILSALLLVFAIFGVWRTLGHLVEGMDASSTTELVEAALEGIGSIIGSLFDGV